MIVSNFVHFVSRLNFSATNIECQIKQLKLKLTEFHYNTTFFKFIQNVYTITLLETFVWC